MKNDDEILKIMEETLSDVLLELWDKLEPEERIRCGKQLFMEFLSTQW
jgi:hypothetical protein